jgi:hypothetical protein
MAEARLTDKFTAFRPSKTLWFWSTVACMILVPVVGFTWGGWVTAGSAAERVSDAADQATAKLAAQICAYRFLAAPDAATQLAALQKESSYQQDDFIEKGGWVTLAGAKEPIDGAGSLCAKQLADAKLPTGTPVASAETTSE